MSETLARSRRDAKSTSDVGRDVDLKCLKYGRRINVVLNSYCATESSSLRALCCALPPRLRLITVSYIRRVWYSESVFTCGKASWSAVHSGEQEEVQRAGEPKGGTILIGVEIGGGSVKRN